MVERQQIKISLFTKVAKQLLCVPATSLQSERVFSVSGTMTNARIHTFKKNLPKVCRIIHLVYTRFIVKCKSYTMCGILYMHSIT